MIYRRAVFAFLAALGLITSTGCCCGPCGWYPGKSLFEACGCGCRGGCGPVYWNDYYNDPPDSCDPCDCHGNFTGRGCGCGGPAMSYGGSAPSCGCGGGGGGAPMGPGDGYEEEGYMPGPQGAGVPTQVARRQVPRRVRPVRYAQRPRIVPTNEDGSEASVTATSYAAPVNGTPCTTCRR